MDKQQFDAKYNMDCQRFFEMIHHMGPDLNSRKNRFDKADLIEHALEVGTSSRLRWVDELGYDLIDSVDETKFESKSQKFCLYTKTGKKKSKTTELKLTNTLQNSLEKKLDCTSDHLLIVDTGSPKSYAIAIISYSTVVEKYSTQKSDGFSCQIPIDELTFLFEPGDFLIRNVGDFSRYSDEKKRLQREFVNRFMKECYEI